VSTATETSEASTLPFRTPPATPQTPRVTHALANIARDLDAAERTASRVDLQKWALDLLPLAGWTDGHVYFQNHAQGEALNGWLGSSHPDWFRVPLARLAVLYRSDTAGFDVMTSQFEETSLKFMTVYAFQCFCLAVRAQAWDNARLIVRQKRTARCGRQIAQHAESGILRKMANWTDEDEVLTFAIGSNYKFKERDNRHLAGRLLATGNRGLRCCSVLSYEGIGMDWDDVSNVADTLDDTQLSGNNNCGRVLEKLRTELEDMFRAKGCWGRPATAAV
jgi:hypothetical protein